MDKIRISCACFARIEIGGKYLLLQNKKMKNKGIINYSPIGGALEWKPEALEFLESVDVSFEKGKDLRIHIPKENYDIFKQWFLSNKDRENSVFREMREELVDEENILSYLDYLDVSEKYINCVETTQDWEVDGKMQTSYYFFEIFDVKFNKDVENKILENIKIEDKLKLFTPLQIKTFSNTIAGSSKYILPNF